MSELVTAGETTFPQRQRSDGAAEEWRWRCRDGEAGSNCKDRKPNERGSARVPVPHTAGPAPSPHGTGEPRARCLSLSHRQLRSSLLLCKCYVQRAPEVPRRSPPEAKGRKSLGREARQPGSCACRELASHPGASGMPPWELSLAQQVCPEHLVILLAQPWRQDRAEGLPLPLECPLVRRATRSHRAMCRHSWGAAHGGHPEGGSCSGQGAHLK